MRARRIKWGAGTLLAGLVLASPMAARGDEPAPAQIRLENAGPEAIAQELERALGAPVQVRGGAGRQVTLNLLVASPEASLERVAAALGGRWRLKLRVRSRGADEKISSPILDRRVLIGFQDVSARRALTLLARELGADLETDPSVGTALDRKVTVLANGISAGEILDLIADQAEAAWSLAYRIEAPNAPPPRPRVERAPEPAPMPPSMPPPPVVMTAAKPEPPLPVASGPELRAGVHAAMTRVLRASPDQRELAVLEFMAEMEELFLSLGRLSPLERETRIRTIIPVLGPWKRLHQGLAPEVQKQLAPVSEVLEKHLRI